MQNRQESIEAYRLVAALSPANRSFARMKRLLHFIVASLLVAGLMSMPASAANDASQIPGYERAHTFLQDRQNAIDILSFLHFGAAYNGHQLERVVGVVDGDGNPVEGKFALVYRFHWADDGVTDIAFFCNGKGQIYDSQIERSNGQISTPFAFANLSIQLVGRLVVNSDKKMSDADRKLAIKLIDQADAHGLLNLWLALQ